MGEALTLVLLAVAVFVLGLASSFVASWITLTPVSRALRNMGLRSADPELDMRLTQLKAAYNLCEQQLAGQFEVSKRRLAAIHQLQAEVRALKFEREARESEQ